MAFDLSFTTSDYNVGQSILITDSSTDWASAPAAITSVTFTITSLYTGTVLTPTPFTKVVLVGVEAFAAGFQHEITSTELGFVGTVPDSIYRIVMTLQQAGVPIVAGAGNTYTSDEVMYYNAKHTRDHFISTKATYIDDVHNQDMDYANWLDFLITSIESNGVVGNSSAIYYIFDIFDRLDT
jgi:hypothetical protein